MRVIVTGATGFIGRTLVRLLAERGDDVAILTRDEQHGWGRVPPGGPTPKCCHGAGRVDFVRWSPDRAGPWESALDGADAVVHLAGAGIFDERWTRERKDELRASRIVSTELLAQAMARMAVPPRVFVSGSAVGYYGTKTGARTVTETAPPGDDFLATLARDWEAAAEGARSSGVRVCNPRTGLVLGRHGGLLAKLVPAFSAYIGGPIGDGEQFVPWIHEQDVARAIAHAIDSEAIDGPFNVTAPEPATMNAFARELGRALGRPCAVRVPAMAVKLALGEASDTVLTGQRALPQKLVAGGFAFLFPDLASALADLLPRAQS